MDTGFSVLVLLVIAVVVAILVWLVVRARKPALREPLERVVPKPVSRQAKPDSGSEPPKVDVAAEPNQQPEANADESIFVCYRRGDSADVTGRIRDHLVNRFGKEAVFTDVDSIPLGVDFRKHLDQVVGQCRVLVAVVGPRWAERSESSGSPLDGGDFVRIELESALNRDIPVIPVLVGGATMPPEESLPQSIRGFSFRNATRMRPDPDFRADIQRLIDSLESHLQPSQAG